MTKRVNFDDYVEQYNQLLQDKTSFFSKNDTYFARYKVALIKSRLLRPISRVLEYGCGIGRNIPFLREAFPEASVVGTDISRSSIEIARQYQPDVDFFVEGSDVSQLGLFDLIFIAGVYHHVPINERSHVTDLLYRRLHSKGDVFVFEHNPYNPVTRHIVSNCPYDDDAVLLSPRELVKCLSAEGFKKAYTQYCLFIPPSLTRLAWLEARLGWLLLGGQYFIHMSK